MLRSTLAALGLVLLALAACSDTGGPDSPDPAVRGLVIDAGGVPVPGAAVVVDLDFTGPATMPGEKPQTAIGFSVPEPGYCTLRITDVCDEEVFYAFADSLPAGRHSLTWDAKDLAGREVVEGVFHVHLDLAGRDPARMTIAVARNFTAETGEFATVACATVHDTWRVAAWTDDDGRFRIARDCWEFGQSLILRDESGDQIGIVTVVPRVRVWAYPADGDRGSGSAWTDFDDLTGAAVTVRLGGDG
ncbi:MAG: hypothetical protein IH621_17715 [Krumholzibacteria bacterium]|nr:hypothetical protein [Candidatus Krumholzibacteria bacterium]